MAAADPTQISKIATGIQGLDRILDGGLPRGEIHLIQGSAGMGKTTAAKYGRSRCLLAAWRSGGA